MRQGDFQGDTIIPKASWHILSSVDACREEQRQRAYHSSDIKAQFLNDSVFKMFLFKQPTELESRRFAPMLESFRARCVFHDHVGEPNGIFHRVKHVER
jgi:hypothetical protein